MSTLVYSVKPARRRELYWVGSTLDDLRAFPEEVRLEMGHALHLAQLGDKSPDARPLRGFQGAGVLEVVEHIATDQRDLELIRKRLSDAEQIDKAKREQAGRK